MTTTGQQPNTTALVPEEEALRQKREDRARALKWFIQNGDHQERRELATLVLELFSRVEALEGELRAVKNKVEELENEKEDKPYRYGMDE